MAAIGSLLVFAPGVSLAQTTDDLFSKSSLQRVDLELHSADWAKLKEDFQSNTYYPADFKWNGQTVYNVGIRSRGRGSRNANKPGLKVDFDQYSGKQKFLGLKSLVLDNLTQDPSGVHETVSMAFYERLGIPTPREAHVRLYVRGEYVGLYALIESVDKDFLARIYGSIGDDVQNDGWLYEFSWQDHYLFTDLGTGLAEIKLRFDATTHESKSDEEKYRPIQELITLANQTPTDRFVEVIGARFDIPGFIRFVAAQAYLGDTDGFLGAFGMNNFYLYRLENQNKHVLIAWDTDNTFWGSTFPVRPPTDNVLMQSLMVIPEYEALWYQELARANQMAEADGWLEAEITREVQAIDQAMKEDVLKPYSNNSYEGQSGLMLSFARDRIAYVKCALTQGDRACGG
ncbi:MAG TPA: CotH kinase family protein [Vicinamibacterales bacterium]|nr:CotH kinase family protein [Vicinamibacterales bacterium]